MRRPIVNTARHRNLDKLIVASVFGLLSLASVGHAEESPPIFLDQNWDSETRQGYYTTSQGSRIMPYSWFISLEAADSEQSFAATALIPLGYLPNPQSRTNPDGLPVGFAIDTASEGETFIGLNCAACHTNRISYQGRTFQIDGAPTLADTGGLIRAIKQSIDATIADSAKFDRFARSVLQGDYSHQRAAELKGRLDEFKEYWDEFTTASTPPHPWGRARLDAFGMIFNRVSAIDLDLPENNRSPNAPVSFPFLWGASAENKVQWNGSASNENDIERLGRNVGEVLGVFAEAELRKTTILRPYQRTSAKRLNQLWLEDRLKELTSPVWPEEYLGAIDPVKKEAGRILFQQHCVSCHEIVPHGQQSRHVDVVMTPLVDIGTDRLMAENAVNRTSKTGRLEGSRRLFSKPLPAEVPTLELLANVVVGAILSPFGDVSSDFLLQAMTPELDTVQLNALTQQKMKSLYGESASREEELIELLRSYEAKYSRYFEEIEEKPQTEAPAARATSNPLLAYKGRPLDGIWATAPYLHSGSVANLYEILLPGNERLQKFWVGSSEFDPVKVGFQTTEGSGTTLLDTSWPGSSRLGHDTYGNDTFTEEQRWQLVEYMKSL